ncbi:MAG: site-specific integrase, partial [Lentisphaeraceae bacterium]|nr:site-specific integrase [Lentisphaeraceae bacterium]
ELRWRAHLAPMCLLGLSAHEVRQLTSKALYQAEDDQWMLHVRGSKAESRERRLRVPTQLLGILQEYKAADFVGANLFFPAIYGENELWHEDTFSRHINGFQKSKHEYIQGKIPKEFSCLSLRKTFASLWLRSKPGRSYADLAAILGNDPVTAKNWYAEIMGAEVDTEI